MVERRNITIALDEDLLVRLRVLAARKGTSVTGLLRAELRRLVALDEGFEAARHVARRRLERGAHLGGGPLPPRDELHDRGSLR